MAEVFTLSGPIELGATVSPTDLECAEKVKLPLVIGGVSRIAGVGVGLFGTYKLLKGRGAAGVVAVLGAAILWFEGGRLMAASARRFEACRKN